MKQFLVLCLIQFFVFDKTLAPFLYADEEFKINKIMEMYGDTKQQAIVRIKKSNTARSTYYSLVANKVWGEKETTIFTLMPMTPKKT